MSLEKSFWSKKQRLSDRRRRFDETLNRRAFQEMIDYGRKQEQELIELRGIKEQYNDYAQENTIVREARKTAAREILDFIDDVVKKSPLANFPDLVAMRIKIHFGLE